jgi:hypothetical protein
VNPIRVLFSQHQYIDILALARNLQLIDSILDFLLPFPSKKLVFSRGKDVKDAKSLEDSTWEASQIRNRRFPTQKNQRRRLLVAGPNSPLPSLDLTPNLLGAHNAFRLFLFTLLIRLHTTLL